MARVGKTSDGGVETNPGGSIPGGPLRGVRVIDATTTFAGPYGTYILAQMGADVIKVERPPAGDIARGLLSGRSPNMSSVFLNMNHGKRSLGVDLKAPQGRAVLDRMLSHADVFVHNIRLAAVKRLSLHVERIRERNPSLIYCQITGFGSGGPYEGRPAYDDVVQGMSGLAKLQGLPSATPTYVNSVVADKTVGLTAAYAIVAALFARERSGLGESIEVPMYETMASYVLAEHMAGMTYEPPLGPAVYPRTVSPFRRPYRTADGHISVLVYTDDQWDRFFELIGRADLSKDSRFQTAAQRTANVDTVYGLVEQMMAGETTAFWLENLEKADIPSGEVSSVEDLIEDPHLKAVGLFESLDHPSEGSLRVVRPPVLFGGRRPASPKQVAPAFGQHTRTLLSESGYGDEAVDDLIRGGIVFAAD